MKSTLAARINVKKKNRTSSPPPQTPPSSTHRGGLFILVCSAELPLRADSAPGVAMQLLRILLMRGTLKMFRSLIMLSRTYRQHNFFLRNAVLKRAWAQSSVSWNQLRLHHRQSVSIISFHRRRCGLVFGFFSFFLTLRSPQTASTVHLSQMELFQLLNKLFDTIEKRKSEKSNDYPSIHFLPLLILHSGLQASRTEKMMMYLNPPLEKLASDGERTFYLCLKSHLKTRHFAGQP